MAQLGCSSAAAAAAAVIPFHCIICFDEFNLQERHPVVLPCGHTYVCAPCSKRLTKCMECRLPLCWQAAARQSPPKSSNHNKMHGMGLSSSPSRQATTTPSPADQVPMPKNVVLMSLMEASMRVRLKEEEEEEEETENVMVGMQALSGACGTYAVREERGLAVLPNHPLLRRRKGGGSTQKIFRDPFTIQQGQTCQVVGLEDGVFKLARGEGYIVATGKQLVKVAGPKETCCQLEGMMDLVEVRKLELAKKQHQVESLQRDIETRILNERQKEPQVPIITPVPCLMPMTALSMVEDSSSDCSSSCATSTSDAVSCSSTCPKTPPLQDRRASPAPLTPQRQDSMKDMVTKCSKRLFGGQEDNAENLRTPPARQEIFTTPLVPRTIDNSEICRFAPPCDVTNELVELSCSAGLFGDFSNHNTKTTTTTTTRSSSSRFSSSSGLFPVPSLSNHSFDSNASSVNTTNTANTSSGIDFRTGMSGHRALLSVKKIHTCMYRGEIRMMSEHNGIARVRRPVRRSYSCEYGR